VTGVASGFACLLREQIPQGGKDAIRYSVGDDNIVIWYYNCLTCSNIFKTYWIFFRVVFITPPLCFQLVKGFIKINELFMFLLGLLLVGLALSIFIYIVFLKTDRK